MHATDRGITLGDTITEDAAPIGSERRLKTIGYVVTRYGVLSLADLRTLVQASTPWQLGMKSTSSPRIE